MLLSHQSPATVISQCLAKLDHPPYPPPNTKKKERKRNKTQAIYFFSCPAPSYHPHTKSFTVKTTSCFFKKPPGPFWPQTPSILSTISAFINSLTLRSTYPQECPLHSGLCAQQTDLKKGEFSSWRYSRYCMGKRHIKETRVTDTQGEELHCGGLNKNGAHRLIGSDVI